MNGHSPTCERLVAAPNGIDGHVQDCNCGFVIERGPRLSGDRLLDSAIYCAGASNVQSAAIRQSLEAFLQVRMVGGGWKFFCQYLTT